MKAYLALIELVGLDGSAHRFKDYQLGAPASILPIM